MAHRKRRKLQRKEDSLYHVTKPLHTDPGTLAALRHQIRPYLAQCPPPDVSLATEEPFKYKTEVQVKVKEILVDGKSLASDEDGRVFQVPFALPGEEALVSVWGLSTEGIYLADLLKVLKPAEIRTRPPCQYFGSCSGCQLQNASYEFQLELKRRTIEVALRELNLLVGVQDVHPSPKTVRYRSKITPHFDGRPSVKPEGDSSPDMKHLPNIGFSRTGSSHVLDLEDCLLATERVSEGYVALRRSLMDGGITKYRKGATLLVRENYPAGVVTEPRARATARVNGVVFQFPAGSFFQNNQDILPDVVSHVSQEIPTDCTHLIDAYCGTGFFALSLAKKFVRVAGIDIANQSIEWASENALSNNLEGNVEFVLGDATMIFQNVASYPRDKTAVIIDPPRKGCSEEFISQLLEFSPRSIVYVSCNAFSQARDLKSLLTAYQVTSVQPFDFFPQTMHVENIVSLSRISSN